MVDTEDREFEQLLDAMKRAAGVLNEAGIPFILGGGLACWARGAPKTEHDVDFLLRPRDVERARHALAAAGMVSAAIERQAGIETIPHLTTRDWSVMSSSIRGAAAQ